MIFIIITKKFILNNRYLNIIFFLDIYMYIYLKI